MSSIVRLGPEYFPLSDAGIPISNADIYVGLPDTDPEIVSNQKQVSVLQEDSSVVEIDQPVNTGGGGVPLYNGSPVTVLVAGDYSLKVLNSSGSQIYYVPNTSATVSQLYEVDPSEPDQGAAGGGNSLKDLVDAIGATSEATILFPRGTSGNSTIYTFLTSITTTENIFLEFANGAIVRPAAGISLTVYSPENIIAGPKQQIVDPVNNSTNPLLFTTSGELSPLWLHDGGATHEDTIQMANNSFATPGYGVVRMPAGSYSIGAVVDFSNQISFIGAGWKHTNITGTHAGQMLRWQGTGDHVNDGDNREFFTVSGLNLDGGGISTYCLLIDIARAFTVEDCRFTGATLASFWIGGDTVAPDLKEQASTIVIRRNWFQETVGGVRSLVINSVSNTRILENEFAGNPDAGASLVAASLKLTNCASTKVNNNMFATQAKLDDILIDYTSLFTDSNHLAGPITIDGNHFEGNTNLDEYSGAVARITGATAADPVVITTPVAHGYVTGDRLVIGGVEGMTEINKRYYRVVYVDLTSFSLKDAATGVDIDGTGYSAFSLGNGRGRAVKATHVRISPGSTSGLSAEPGPYVITRNLLGSMNLIFDPTDSNGIRGVYLHDNQVRQMRNTTNISGVVFGQYVWDSVVGPNIWTTTSNEQRVIDARVEGGLEYADKSFMTLHSFDMDVGDNTDGDRMAMGPTDRGGGIERYKIWAPADGCVRDWYLKMSAGGITTGTLTLKVDVAGVESTIIAVTSASSVAQKGKLDRNEVKFSAGQGIQLVFDTSAEPFDPTTMDIAAGITLELDPPSGL